MKSLFRICVATLFCCIGSLLAMGAETPIAYGIRVYYDGMEDTPQSLVAFPTDKPWEVSEVLTLDNMFVRAAACNEGVYYMLHCDDGLVASSLWKLEITTERLEKICDYDYDSRGSNLMVMDMTYDATTNRIYALAYDLLGATVGDDESGIDIPFGLFWLDPTTGDANLVGYQEFLALATIAANPEGCLYALDYEGTLWDINKSTARPGDEICCSYAAASMLQSMAFDSQGWLYWAGFDSPEDSATAQSWFSTFEFKDDCIVYNKVGNMSAGTEIVGLWIDENPLSPSAPARPENFQVIPADKGTLAATIRFAAPSVTISGAQLSGAVDFSVKRVSPDSAPVEVAFLSGKEPGAVLTVTDNPATAGLYTYTVVPFNAMGKGRATLPREKWIGVDAPGRVANLTAQKNADNYDIVVSWEAPATGEHDGWYDVDDLTYEVKRLPDNCVIADAATACTITDNTITSLQGYSYEVTARSGALTGPAALSQHVVSGPALNLPAKFNFSTVMERNLWAGYANSVGDNWDDFYYSGIELWCKRFYPLVLEPFTADASSLASPPLMLKAGSHYCLKYDMRAYGQLSPLDFSITYGPTPASREHAIFKKTEMMDANLSFEQRMHGFVAAATGACYVSFNVDNLSPAWIANVEITEMNAADLQITAISGAKVANAGTPVSYAVDVLNTGYEALTGIVVNICDDNDIVLASAALTESVPSLATSQVMVEWIPQQEGEVSIHAEAKIDGKAVKSPSMKVDVLGSGHWVTIGSTVGESGVSPFYLLYQHSWEQTIYTSREIASEAGPIYGLMLYYNIVDEDLQPDFDAEIWLGNTDMSTFADATMVATAGMTQVYAGKISLASGSGLVTLIFDEPFRYEGNNLILACKQSNAGGFTMSLRWMCSYGKEYADRTLYYRGDEPYSGMPTGLLQEVPKLSLWMDGTGSNSDIDAMAAEVVTTEYYNLQGQRVAHPQGGIYVRVERKADGTVHACKCRLR